MIVEAVKNLTLFDISVVVLFIVGLIKGVKELKKSIKEFLQTLLKDQFKGVNDKLDEMQYAITKLDTQECKNFIVRYLADVERGDYIYESEQQRFWEEYDHYIDDLHENSYIKEWVNRLRKEGKLERSKGF